MLPGNSSRYAAERRELARRKRVGIPRRQPWRVARVDEGCAVGADRVAGWGSGTEQAPVRAADDVTARLLDSAARCDGGRGGYPELLSRAYRERGIPAH